MQNLGVAITGSGSALPANCLDNETLSKLVDTSDEWIASRTGIRQRRLATSAQSVSEIAAMAAKGAIAMAGISPLDIDLIILATLRQMIFLAVPVKFKPKLAQLRR